MTAQLLRITPSAKTNHPERIPVVEVPNPGAGTDPDAPEWLVVYATPSNLGGVHLLRFMRDVRTNEFVAVYNLLETILGPDQLRLIEQAEPSVEDLMSLTKRVMETVNAGGGDVTGSGIEVKWVAPDEIVKAVLSGGGKAVVARLADAIVADARRLVPVDTGALRGTIRHTGVDPDGTVDVVAGDATVDYAGHVEYGTSRGPAQPYMRPAVHKNRGVVR